MSLKTHLYMAGEAHGVHQHCDREQGLGPGCSVPSLGSVFLSLEAAPQLMQIMLVSLTCGGCYVLTSITACQFIFFLLSCFAIPSQFNC